MNIPPLFHTVGKLLKSLILAQSFQKDVVRNLERYSLKKTKEISTIFKYFFITYHKTLFSFS